MPKEITLDDGSTETVYSQEEVDGYKAGSDKNKERKAQIETLSKDMDLQEGETFEDKLKEMKENANPNFAKYRTKFKAMEKALGDDGKKFDDNGNAIEGNQVLTSEDIAKQIEESVAKKVGEVTNTTARTEALSNFTKEDQDVIKPHLDKLMTAYPEDLSGNLDMAIQKAFPGGVPSQVQSTLSSAGGSGPRINTDGKKEKFTDSDEGKQTLSNMLSPEIKKAIAAKEAAKK